MSPRIQAFVLLPGLAAQLMTAQQDTRHSNRLEKEHSAYLRSAAHQPVNWYPWSPEAFEAARKENKPVLLDIGAVWCHWCHVMDMESYENDSIASLINENFVSVKVDRDERPDIDARYQAAVSAISGQGGWPLTAFLTPDGNVFYGGTYFPPEDRYGRAGFPTVLQILSEKFQKERDKIQESTSQVDDAVRNYLARTSDPVDLSESLVDSALSSISREYDPRFGGFGTAPKFPHASAIELLIARYDFKPEQWILDIVTNTLRKMAKGGIYDQLGGGFHRYSTDEKWIVPHFEKMMYDNAPLLINYVHAYQITGDEYFKTIALDVVRYVNEVLSDQEHGGFYASQDADVEFGDDGSYFTWTRDAAASLLTPDEFEVARLHYNIHDVGEMHYDSTQNVLFVDKDLDVIAEILKKPPQQIEDLLQSARRKMLQTRKTKRAPFVDTAVYSSWNGMMITAYCEAYKAIGKPEIKDRALKSLRRILAENIIDDHFVTHRAAALATEGFLDDQVEIADALLAVHEITGESDLLLKAIHLMHNCIALFWDERDGGFFDVPKGHSKTGALSIPNKPIQDSPTPAGNSSAIIVLNRLYALTEEQRFRNIAEKALKCLAPTVKNFGIFGATYFLALHEFLNPPPHVVVVANSDAEDGTELFTTALRTFRYGKTVTKTHLNNSRTLPKAVPAMAVSTRQPAAYVCTAFSCAPPAFDSQTLASTIKSFNKLAVSAR